MHAFNTSAERQNRKDSWGLLAASPFPGSVRDLASKEQGRE